MHHTAKTIIDYQNYLRLKNYQESSIKHYLSQAKAYENYKAKHDENINNYYQYLASKNLKNSSLNSHLQGLKIYAHYLKSTSQKTFSIPLLREKIIQEKVDYLTLEEVKKLFATAKKRLFFECRDKAILGCLYHLALRISEASNLLLEDIDLENNLVFVQKSKTGYQRQVPISLALKTIFENYIQQRETIFKGQSDNFLLGLKGKIGIGAVANILKKLAQESKINKRIYPHLLRHSIATHLLSNGMPLDKVSQFLGHKNIGSTQRYTHL